MGNTANTEKTDPVNVSVKDVEAPPEPSHAFMTVAIPPGLAADVPFLAVTPDGQSVRACVPPGMQDGQEMVVTYKPLAAGAKPKKAQPEDGKMVTVAALPPPKAEPLPDSGLVVGCKRDMHLGMVVPHAFLITMVLGIPLIGFYAFISFPFVVVAFFLEGLISRTFRHLLSIKGGSEMNDLLNSWRTQTPVVVRWHMVCSHESTTSSTGSHDSHGNMTSSTSHTVVTHTADVVVPLASWSDASPPVGDIERYRMTKLDLSRTVVGDEVYLRHEHAWRQLHSRDPKNSFTAVLELEGFTDRALAIRQGESTPFFVGPYWFLLAQLSVIFALPYRVWLSSITGKADVKIVKQVCGVADWVPE